MEKSSRTKEFFKQISAKILPAIKSKALSVKVRIKCLLISGFNRTKIIRSYLKRFGLWLVKSLFKVARFLSKVLPIVLFICLTVFFIYALVLLVYYDRMGEVDAALKYILIPVYIFSAIFSGRLAKQNIKKQLVILLKREPESRWATNEEIIKLKDIGRVERGSSSYECAGIPFIVNESSIYVDNGEAHSLIIGSTGSGKTRRLVLPLINTLARKGESIVTTDPKGELFTQSKAILEKLGYKIVCVNFREPARGNAWNPLGIPYEYYKSGNKDKAMELLFDLGLNIFFDKGNSSKQDPFWERSAANYFSGLALALFENAKKEEINLNSIIQMNAVGYEKFAASNYLKEYLDFFEKTHVAYTSASGTVNAPNETRGGILSVFQQKISIYCNQIELSKMLATSDFTMSHIGTEKTAVFIIMHDEKSSYHPLVSAFIKQCYEELIGTAHIHEGALPIRVNLVLDEFANLPPITDMSNMITAARSRKIRINLIIQGSQQLAAHYGKETAEVIKGNCTNWFFLTSKELPLLKEMSELCGQTFEQFEFKNPKEKPLVSVAQLQRFQMGEILIRRDRQYPFKTYLPDISQYSEWSNEDEVVSDVSAINRADVSIFDLKEYVKEEKRKELFDSLEKNKDKDAQGDNSQGNVSQAVNDSSNKANIDELSSSFDFDTDKVTERIDQKIKELEKEEERKKAEEQEKADNQNPSPNKKRRRNNKKITPKQENKPEQGSKPSPPPTKQ